MFRRTRWMQWKSTLIASLLGGITIAQYGDWTVEIAFGLSIALATAANLTIFRRQRPRRPFASRQSLPRMSDKHAYAFIGLASVGLFLTVFFWPSEQANLAAASLEASSFSCRVSSITDGDTLRCVDGTRIRLHAVAARERDGSCSPGHPCPTASAAAATAKLTELAQGQALSCRQIGTSYDRVTAVCRNEANVEINCAMVESGTALLWPKFNAQSPICRSLMH